MSGTTPICAYCGRPVLSTFRTGNAGEYYHIECCTPNDDSARLRAEVKAARNAALEEAAMVAETGSDWFNGSDDIAIAIRGMKDD